MAALPKRVKRMLVAVSKTAILSASPASEMYVSSPSTDVTLAGVRAPAPRARDREHGEQRCGAAQHSLPFRAPGALQTMSASGSTPRLIRYV